MQEIVERTSGFDFGVAKEEPLPPDDDRSGDIFSRLGYKIADAIADLVDNSVDAGAGHVHVRFVRSPKGIHSVVIADDGHGMDDSELREAMRFGSKAIKSGKQLGKYGIGLKSASLSQAETVTVLSKKAGKVCGRRWTLENVKRGWTCQVLRTNDVEPIFALGFGDLVLGKSGTIVLWERLEHLQSLPSNIEAVLERTIKELSIELGIRFHRFFERNELKVSIDQQSGLADPGGIPLYVAPLNPFSYERSGHPDYPIALNFKVAGVSVKAECHIWPAKSNAPGYRLGGGKVALRQGFYFYRNDRIIQAGGWNGVRVDDGEPHLSLARVRVDLPAQLDSMFKLDVTKSYLDPSPEFIAALQAAHIRGLTFDKYLGHAQGAYRRQKKKDSARFPFVPGTGISTKARRAIALILEEKGVGKPRKVGFKWTKLDHDEIFRVDAERTTIHLNSRYKMHLLEGDSRDTPVLKIALLFLLQDELDKSFQTGKSIDTIQRINQALIASLKA
jgi:hypothetical protein